MKFSSTDSATARHPPPPPHPQTHPNTQRTLTRPSRSFISFCPWSAKLDKLVKWPQTVGPVPLFCPYTQRDSLYIEPEMSAYASKARSLVSQGDRKLLAWYVEASEPRPIRSRAGDGSAGLDVRWCCGETAVTGAHDRCLYPSFYRPSIVLLSFFSRPSIVPSDDGPEVCVPASPLTDRPTHAPTHRTGVCSVINTRMLRSCTSKQRISSSWPSCGRRRETRM